MGWAVEQTSWRKPGRVSASVRHPPPTESDPSTTVTERPAAARVTAAARPLGPDPTTTTSTALMVRSSGPQCPLAPGPGQSVDPGRHRSRSPSGSARFRTPCPRGPWTRRREGWLPGGYASDQHGSARLIPPLVSLVDDISSFGSSLGPASPMEPPAGRGTCGLAPVLDPPRGGHPAAG